MIGKWDFNFTPQNKIWMLQPVTGGGRLWLDNHVPTEPWQWLGGAVAVEDRYVDQLVAGIHDAGLTVTVNWAD